MEQPRTRQELYEMIRETSKEEFILSEMKRLGFWDVEQGLPKLSEDLIKRKGELDRELRDLLNKQRVWNQKERLLKEMRKKRMEEAKARREETKKKREEKRKEKARVWKEKQENDVVYLGKKVSRGLNDTQHDETKLKSLGLPIFKDIPSLTEAMGIDAGRLRFLAYDRDVTKLSHYKKFTIPKKTGGVRHISAPMLHLKNAQYWILENILYKMDVNEHAHGFVPGKSILTNAAMHVGKELVINIDLKNFFPTLTFKRIKGMFRAMGYSDQMSTIFGLICSEPDTDEVMLDGEKYYVSKGERRLPQGAPTSPALTNLICYRMDKRFKGIADQLGFTYTRYADDLTFSMPGTDNAAIKKLMGRVRAVVEDEKFSIHPKKIHYMRKGSRKEVTGIVVNEKLSVNRKKLKQFRAVLYRIEKNKSFDGVEWGNGNPAYTIKGFANFVRMVDKEKGQKLMERVMNILSDEAIMKTIKIEIPEEPKKPTATIENKTPDQVDRIQNEEEQDWWRMW